VVDVLLYLLGVAGVAAGITLLFLGMRAVLDIGGVCAEGGPYVTRQSCPQGTTLAMLIGIFGGLGSLLLAAWKGSVIGEGAGSVVFLAWPALFGALGFNFLQYGFSPPGDDQGWAWGWIICGVIFETMAFGPLLVGWRDARGMGASSSSRVAAAAPGGARLAASLRESRDAREARRSALPPLMPAATARPADEPGARSSVNDEALVDLLERLAALHRAGSLSDDEYARAKAELLERAGA